MYKNRLFLGLLCALFMVKTLLSATPAEFEAEFKKMNQGIADYLAKEMPFVNSLGLNDATGAKYGFPFFSVGVSGGLAILPNPVGSLGNVNTNVVDTKKLPISYDVLPIPYNPSIFGRVGIPFLDFDVGIKIGAPVDFSFDKFSYKSMSFGGELRYSILTQGVLPGISVAAGFDYMDANLTYSYNGSFGAYSANFKTENHWHLVNYHVTGRVGYDIAFLSLLGGLQLYIPTGEVETKTTGSFNNGANSLNSTVKGDVGGLRARLLAGAYLRIPLSRIGFQFDIEPQTESMGLSLTAQLVF